MIPNNPCEAVDPPRKEKYQAKVYTPEQLKSLLETVKNTHINLPVVLAVTCGLRRGEVCGIRWQDVDLDKCILFVRNSLDCENNQLVIHSVKTSSSERSVKLPQLALDSLKKEKRQQAEDKLRAGGIYEDKDFCWTWDDGRPYNPDYLYKTFRKVLAKNDLPHIRFHDLRHSHATFLLLAGVPIKVISERLGHSSTRFTQDIYSHVLPQMQEQAANEVDKILSCKR
jgi:integrase